MNALILILGLVFVIFGAQFMVDGSVAVAKRYRMPEFLIGLTIVGIGTSMPEMVVSLIAGIDGNGSIAIGNVVGSNLANVLLILGLSALIRPIDISRATLRIDIPYNILVTAVLLFMCFGAAFWRGNGGVISRFDGIVLLLLFAGYMTYSFRTASKTEILEDAAEQAMPMKMWKAVTLIIVGLGGLVLGGRWFVSGASAIAAALGVSDAVIAITIVAIGTSLPELATSAVASFKGNTQLALGNIIGSNIFNVCLILGVSSMVRPISTTGITPWDIVAPIGAGIALLISAYTFKGNKINRADGALFLLLYTGYIVYLIMRG